MTHTHQQNVSGSSSRLLSLRLRFGKSVSAAAGPLFALLPLLSACGGDDPGGVACPAIAAASLGVTVLDAVSSARICDATVTANDGTTSYSLMAGGDTSNCTYVGPFERAGTLITRDPSGLPDGTKDRSGRDQRRLQRHPAERHRVADKIVAVKKLRRGRPFVTQAACLSPLLTYLFSCRCSL